MVIQNCVPIIFKYEIFQGHMAEKILWKKAPFKRIAWYNQRRANPGNFNFKSGQTFKSTLPKKLKILLECFIILKIG